MKSLLFFFVFALSVNLSAQKSKEQFLIIGTYTPGTSDGIYVYKFNTETGENSFVSSVKASNPSYLTVSRIRNLCNGNENAYNVHSNRSRCGFRLIRQLKLVL
jgi:hypothetical protein